jgi:hypothetical protein
MIVIHFWIDGKRGIMANFCVAFFILLLVSNALSIKRVSILTFFLRLYKLLCKNITANFDETYKELRTEFRRNFGVKFKIYNDLILARNILTNLPNKFDSFILYASTYMPRKYWQQNLIHLLYILQIPHLLILVKNNLYGWV